MSSHQPPQAPPAMESRTLLTCRCSGSENIVFHHDLEFTKLLLCYRTTHSPGAPFAERLVLCVAYSNCHSTCGTFDPCPCPLYSPGGVRIRLTVQSVCPWASANGEAEAPLKSKLLHINHKVGDIHIAPTSRANCDSIQIGLIPLNSAVISCLNLAPLLFDKSASNIL